MYTCARKILDRILSRILDAILWPTQQQATGSVIGADVALLEVGRRWEYLPQRKEMKIVTESKEKRGKEGNGKEGQRAGGQASQAKCKYYIYDTEHTHTHTHTCFQNIVFSVPRTLSLLVLSLYVFIYAYITHTQTHTRSLFMPLTRLYISDRERGGLPSLSRCVCV